MKRAEMPNATRETSYPSPTGAQMSEGGHPFFASQHPMSSNDDLRMSGQQAPGAQLGRAMSDEGSSEEVVQSSSAFNLQGFRQEGFRQDMVSPQQLAQSGLESVGSSGKPRSKVSRACDECRRKKVCMCCFQGYSDTKLVDIDALRFCIPMYKLHESRYHLCFRTTTWQARPQ